MGMFVWTYRNGLEFQTEPAGFRLMVAQAGASYRYQVFDRAEGPADRRLLASGARESLRDAIDAAETAAASIDPALIGEGAALSGTEAAASAGP